VTPGWLLPVMRLCPVCRRLCKHPRGDGCEACRAVREVQEAKATHAATLASLCRGYTEAVLASSGDRSGSLPLLNATYGPGDLTNRAVLAIRADCNVLLAALQLWGGDHADIEAGEEAEAAGRAFWRSRNHEAGGFDARGATGRLMWCHGEALHRFSRSFPGQYFGVAGPNGSVECSGDDDPRGVCRFL
jgi:hypothetical protein